MKPGTTDDVLDLMDAAFTSTALGAAMELGLFWLLRMRPMNAAEIAATLGIPEKRCRYWLQLLSRTGLLDQGTDGYAPSATARAAILDAYSRETWALLAEEARERLPGLRDLPLHIRREGSAWEALGLAPPDYLARMAEDSPRALRFTRMLYEIHQPLTEHLAERLDMSGVDRFMDLGGGSGVLSLALLRRHPHLTAVVVDIPGVCTAGREIAVESSLEDRITYHPADFLRDDLPSGFDLVLECDVDVYGPDLFRKVRTALNSGGRFVIVDQLAPAEGVPHPTRAHWAFQGSMLRPEFSRPTAEEIRSQLTEVGFQILSQAPLPPIPGAATRFTRKTTLIEARK